MCIEYLFEIRWEVVPQICMGVARSTHHCLQMKALRNVWGVLPVFLHSLLWLDAPCIRSRWPMVWANMEFTLCSDCFLMHHLCRNNFTFQNKSYSRSDCTGFMANEQEMVVVIVSKKIGHHILISWVQTILFYRWAKLRFRVVELLTQGHRVRKKQGQCLFCSSFSGVLSP